MTSGFDDIPFFDEEPAPRPAKKTTPEPQTQKGTGGGIAARALAARNAQASNASYLEGLNPEQLRAVETLDGPVLVLAGAGSGKTKTLLQKLIYLIEEKGINPSNILAITFTKNAANEILDRLIISADDTEEYAEILADKNRTVKEKDSEGYFFTKKHKWIDNLTLRIFHSL